MNESEAVRNDSEYGEKRPISSSDATATVVTTTTTVNPSIVSTTTKKKKNKRKKNVSFVENKRFVENGEIYLNQLGFLSGTDTGVPIPAQSRHASTKFRNSVQQRHSQPVWRKIMVVVFVVLVSLAMTYINLRAAMNLFCTYDPDQDAFIVFEKVEQCPIPVKPDSKSKKEKGLHKILNLLGIIKNIKQDQMFHYIDAPLLSVKDQLCRGAFHLLHITALTLHPRVHYKSTVPKVQHQSPCPASQLAENIVGHIDRKKNIILATRSFISNLLKHLLDLFFPSKRSNTLKRNTSTVSSTGGKFDWTSMVSVPLNLSLTAQKKHIINQVISKFEHRLKDECGSEFNTQGWFESRMQKVKYSGGAPWWLPEHNHWGEDKEAKGTRLMTSFLNIMKWPEDLVTNYPFSGICANGCPADFAVYNSLRYREEYQPQKMTVSAINENRKGWLYVRGYSPSRYHEDASVGGSSVLWMTPGLHGMEDHEHYTRVLMNGIDRCVGDALNRSGGKVGKCNIVIDCTGFGISKVPPLVPTKRALKMLQDHNPDRLGVLVLANASSAAQMFLKVLMPFLPDTVRQKIHLVPNDPSKRLEMMKVLVDEKFIPVRMGGTDSYKFNADDYYMGHEILSDAEGIRYYETMPYYAP